MAGIALDENRSRRTPCAQGAKAPPMRRIPVALDGSPLAETILPFVDGPRPARG
jgi:hypothetical protein